MVVGCRAAGFAWQVGTVVALAGAVAACSSSSDGPASAAGAGGSGGQAGTTGQTGGSAGSSAGGGNNAGGDNTGGSNTGGNGGTATGGAGGAAGNGPGGGATGGASGSGGAGGTAGVGGGAGNGAADGGPAASGACPSNASFCSGFEDAVIPQGATYRPSFQAADATKNLALDEAVVKAGKKSLRVNPASAGYDWRMLSVPAPGSTFWVRLYMRSSVDIGQSEHNAYFQAMTGDGEPNAGDNMEVAEQYCQVVLNLHDEVVLTTGGATMCGSSAKPLAKDGWHCMEAFFDGVNGAVQVYADGMTLIDKSGWSKAKLTYKTFSFGYLGFHGPARTLWYDDVAVAPQRIGCAP